MHFLHAKGILSQNSGMNIYRGCSHGCIYCDSRSKCYGFTHAFENIEVKENAPELLERALRSKRHKCMIGVTLREDDREYFYQAPDRDFPGIRQKYVNTYGNAYGIPRFHAKELMTLF